MPFAGKEDGYAECARSGGSIFRGPRRICIPSRISADMVGSRVVALFTRYQLRKFDGISIIQAKSIADRLGSCKKWSRMQFQCGSGTQTVISSSTFFSGKSRDEKSRRISCYVAVEMDVDGAKADVFYGEVLSLLEIDFSDCAPDHVLNNLERRKKFQIGILSWPSCTKKGAQDQLFLNSRLGVDFSAPSMEDVSIIARLVGVVEHTFATQTRQGERNPSLRRRRT